MDIKTMDHDAVLAALPNRKRDAHKGDFGRILLICGSEGYTGAAALSAKGALRAGAGVVYLAVPRSVYQIEATKLDEPVVLPLPSFCGTFSRRAGKRIVELLNGKDAVMIGPGIGQSAGTLCAVCSVLKYFNGPVVLDADGINVLQQHKNILRERTSPTIITPHVGEFERIAGSIGNDRVSAAVSAAIDLNAIVLLKGYETVITDGSSCWINRTGNPGMAVGGSGDVLAGMITALLGQGLEPLMATVCAAWLHGAAGDICAKEIGEYGMLPSDLLDVLPRLMK